MVVLDHGRTPTPFQVRCPVAGCGWQGRWHARLRPAQAREVELALGPRVAAALDAAEGGEAA